MSNEVRTHATLTQWMTRNLPPEVHERATQFVDRFCVEAQLAIATLLVYAEETGKFAEAMRLLEKSWREHWRHEDPGTRGYPDLAQNDRRIGLIYEALHIPPPRTRMH